MHGLGSKLRDIREKRGLTQRMLAARIHKSVPAISGYETDFQTPPTDVLISISKVLHVPIAYFMDSGSEESYSAAGLTKEQQEVLDLLFAEFANPTEQGERMSDQQIEIIRKLILLFSKKENV